MENNNNFYEKQEREERPTKGNNTAEEKQKMVDREFCRKATKLFWLSVAACGILLVFNVWGLTGLIMILLIKRIWNSL